MRHYSVMHKYNLFLIIVCFITPYNSIAWSFFSSSEKTAAPQALGPLAPPPVRFTLMIDPGDGEQATEIAQELKKSLESQISQLRVLLSHAPGESLEPLQIASSANRLKPDLFINLQCFKQQEQATSLSFYQLSYNPVTDFWQQKEQGLQFLPIDQAYRSTIKKSSLLLKTFYETCKQDALELAKEKKIQISCKAPLSIPFKPLVGITAPAFALEIGIKKKSWSSALPLLVHAIETIITQHQPAETVASPTG